MWRAESESKKMNFRETNEDHRWTHFIHPHHWRLHQRRNIIFFVLQLKDISCGWIWEQKCPLIVWLSICDVFQHHTPVDSSRKPCRSRTELQWINYQALSHEHSAFHVHICIATSSTVFQLYSNLFFSKSNYSLKGSGSIKIKWFQYYNALILLFCRKTVVIALNCSVHRLAECD